MLVEAANLMKAHGLGDVRFVLAGDARGRDVYVREIDALIANYGLKGAVVRVGHCSDMPAALLASSVVAVPSVLPESFGRSAVEAQAMGAMVVATDVGAVHETLLAPPDCAPEERTGWRVPPGDAGALADAIHTALTLGASAREAVAARGRAHVERHFSLQRMNDRTLAAYLSLLPG